MKKWIALFFSILLLQTFPVEMSAASLDEVKSLIENEYVGDINGDLHNATSIEEIIDMLDPYSTYFTKEQFDAYIQSIERQSVGIGVIIQKHDKGILIVDVIEGSSADELGITPGDIILSINGTSTVDMTVNEAQSYILGEEFSTVTLECLKEDGSIVKNVLTRKTFSLPVVESEMLYGNVGYIALHSFSENGATLVKQAYEQLLQQGATSFILDLQYNGGGYVTTAEQLISLFPNTPYSMILKTTSSKEKFKTPYESLKFPESTKVLVNRYSASASELTAASLLDQNAAILYGEKTYGKGTMQRFYQFEDGSYLKLTVGEFFGPKGTVVKDTGVTPQILTTSNPLYQAHYDSITENLQNYEELKSFQNVPITKSFTITFNHELSESIPAGSVELVPLGGKTPVKLQFHSQQHQLTISPVTPLTKGGEYILIIHPTINNKNGKHLKNGYYVKITVQP